MGETKGRFGIYGGQYIPETLMGAVWKVRYHPKGKPVLLFHSSYKE